MNGSKHLETCLKYAVPMWIERLKHRSFQDFDRRRNQIVFRDKNGSEYTIATLIGAKGDALLFGGGKKGEPGEIFNYIAEGLAWLALVAKGGVRFGDLHWDAEFETLHKKP